MDLLSLRLVDAVGARISVRSSYSQWALVIDQGWNSELVNFDPSTLIIDLSRYP